MKKKVASLNCGYHVNAKLDIAANGKIDNKMCRASVCTSVMFQRLQAKVIKIVDVSYGGENGFNQAIELAGEALGNVKFIQEKKLIGTVFSVMNCVFCNSVCFILCSL